MSLRIPLRSDLPEYEQQVRLDGVTFTFRIVWNVREEKWYLDVLDELSETVLVGSLKLVADHPLATSIIDRQPAGVLAAVDTSGRGEDPDLAALGDRVRLLYWTTAELAAAAG